MSPRFCTLTTLLPILSVAELAALVWAIVSAENPNHFWTILALASLYLLWIGLSLSLSLCLLQRWLLRLTLIQMLLLLLLLLFVWVVIFTELALGLLQSLLPLLEITLSAYFRWQIYGVALLVGLLALRYLFVLHQWRQEVERQAEQRLEQLQARIRPHFLFNSLNSIASLIATHPAAAEEAVLDFADLMRSHIRQERVLGTVEEELTLCRRYLHLERLRLGERLQIEWQIDSALLTAEIPLLTLQPLLENGVYHGIEPCAAGGSLTLSLCREADQLRAEVVNPLPPPTVTTPHQGHTVALENIAARLRHSYGAEATLEIAAVGAQFRVVVSWPYRAAPMPSSTD